MQDFFVQKPNGEFAGLDFLGSEAFQRLRAPVIANINYAHYVVFVNLKDGEGREILVEFNSLEDSEDTSTQGAALCRIMMTDSLGTT